MTESGPVVPSSLLTPDEVELLVRALLEWGGPGHASDELARGMGFAGAEDLLERCRSFRRDLESDTPIESANWARILLATEIVFVSDLVGSGTEWRTTTGMNDESTIRMLRTIQRKLGKVLRSHYGRTPTGP